MFKKKQFKLFIIIIFLVFSAVFLIYISKSKLAKYPPPWLPNSIQVVLKGIFDKKSFQKISNDYNEKFIPETQLINLKFEKVKLNFLSDAEKGYFQKQVQKTKDVYKNFYIDIYQTEKLMITNSNAQSFLLDISNTKNGLEINEIINLDSNLKPKKVLDTLVIGDLIFTSYIEDKNNCRNFVISKAEINKKYLNYEEFFREDKCAEFIQGGRMQPLTFENKKGLIFSIADNVADRPNDEPQSDNSNFGKLIFKSFDNGKNLIFSKGHRNPQGLLVLDEVILETEHGPKGGDEINKIIYKGNYGWPISSYGKKYKSAETYKKSHKQFGFQEPIFSFVPSIGISELIKVPNSFNEEWQENFLLSSLNKHCLFRIKFDKNFNKVVYYEEIFIGQRIRDLKYFKNHVLLALENKGEIGIFSVKD